MNQQIEEVAREIVSKITKHLCGRSIEFYSEITQIELAAFVIPHLAKISAVEKQKSNEAEQAFVVELCVKLQERGIDTSDWDGDDSAAIIIANNFHGLLDTLRTSNSELQSRVAVMRGLL